MESSSLNLQSLLFLIFIQLSTLTFVHPGNINGGKKLYEVCPTNSNFAPNSSFGYNLNNLYLSLTLYNPPVENGFFNLSYGQNSDQVNAIGLCRRDVTSYVCSSCITEAVVLLTDICPDQTEAIIWYDECMFRYSNRSIFGQMEFEPSHLLTKAAADKGSRVTKSDNKVLTTLLDDLITQAAAAGDSLHMSATGEASGSKNQTIYGLAQCTPDLSGVACKDCLSKAAQSVLKSGVEAASFLTPSCIIRYDNHVFYDLSVPNLSPPPSNAPILPPNAPALPPNRPSPSPSPLPPTDATAPPPSVDEPPPPAVFDESPPPSFFDEPLVPPPVEELPPPPSEFEAPVPSPQLAPELEPIVDYPDDLGKGNMNGRFQALAIVVPLVILQFFAF